MLGWCIFDTLDLNQNRLCHAGHYGAGFTLCTYTHTTRQNQDDAAQAMGNLMAQVR